MLMKEIILVVVLYPFHISMLNPLHFIMIKDVSIMNVVKHNSNDM
jgi:hypothetical protein